MNREEKIKELLNGASWMWKDKSNEPSYGLNYHKGDYPIYLNDLKIWKEIQKL